MLPWLTAASVAAILIYGSAGRSISIAGFSYQYSYFAIALFIFFTTFFLIKAARYLKERSLLLDYLRLTDELKKAEVSISIPLIQKTIVDAQHLAIDSHLAKATLEFYLPRLNSCIAKLRKSQIRAQLESELLFFQKNCDEKIAAIREGIPLIKARRNIEATFAFLGKRREEITDQWHQAYETFSWWNKLKYGPNPDLCEMDKVIKDLELTRRLLLITHKEDFERLNAHFAELKQRAELRVAESWAAADKFITVHGDREGLDSKILQKALWLSALSIPVSMWIDVDNATDVYDALRQVNGNFADMSDMEIWGNTLFLSSESLAGLASLTKGAYFEQLVTADTGGALHAHFNHADSDIVIDGVAYQLKATSSTAYINGVDQDIPVIATSEVAAVSRASDSGFSNEELTTRVDLALGGTIVDVGDTAVDAVLTGLGGLGFFATIRGVNHASEKYKNGGDSVEAIFEGAGVAIEGTARALVGTAELGYKLAMSRPSRFLGRMVAKGFVKLDDTLMGVSSKKES